MKKTLTAYLQLMRLDKPIGTFLLLWPVLWALWLANAGLPEPRLLLIFVAGTFIMRAAGCVINDVFDRNLDPHVARTQHRPLADKRLSVKHALAVFFVLMLLALGLVLQLNTLSLVIACVAALLTLLYPLCKRFTQLPQLVLGVTFNTGVLMAFSASQNQLPPLAWLLFVSTVIWTVAYDTLYAMVDKPDDIKLGIKSTAVLWGDQALGVTAVLYAVFLLGLVICGYWVGLSALYYGACGIAAAWMAYQLYTTAQQPSARAFQAFLANNLAGGAIFLGIVLGLSVS